MPRKSYERFWNYSPLRKLTITSIRELEEEIDVYNIETETGTYIANGLAVHNCYQINKGHRRMSMETAKKFVDMLLDADESNTYINPTISPFLIIEFIGGDPLLEIDLIDDIMTYFTEQAFIRRHPWATRYVISLCTNGVLYFEPNVQRFLNKHKNHISLNVTIDGNKELHDSCRVFPDGRPSYDLAVAAAKDWMENKKGYMGSKITIAPGNITYLYDALVHMIDLGYEEINANCVYEEGWELPHAQELYRQMKKFADYLLDNKLDYIYCSLFEDNFFHPKKEGDDQNWCWGAGTPILTVDGYKPIEEIEIGDMVYTHDGTIHPVINTMSHFADNVIHTKMSGVFDLVCTKNHKLFVTPFDYIGWQYKKHFGSPCKKEVASIKHKDLVHLFTLPERTVHYDESLAYLVGRYIGDGWSFENNTGHAICCSSREAEELIQKFEEAGILYGHHINKTVEQFPIRKNASNGRNVELHRILAECGKLAHGKHIPSECFCWDNSSLKALLHGYLDADGCFNQEKQQYRFNTVSYRLAQEMMLILRTLGYTPTCYRNQRSGESKIQGRTVHIRDRYEVYFYSNPKRGLYVHNYNQQMCTYGLKIFDAEPQMVYNITVDENHSYIAGGIVSANCGGTGLHASLRSRWIFVPLHQIYGKFLG